MSTLKIGSKGEDVKNVQAKLNELGFDCGKADGIFGSKTEKAVKAFQKANKLTVDGIVGKNTQAKLFPSDTVKSNANTSEKRSAVVMDWWTSDIQKIFAKGVTATITDVRTGLTWKEIRKAGKNHADVQPCTKVDTAKLKKAYGGNWSWARRPIWVTINGVNYAASMNGMPHGGSSVSGNGFPGHHCIHFTNSRTHGSNRVDENHQKAIKEAAKARL